LFLPLKVSPYHLTQLERGELKAAQVFTDRYRKWWVTLAVRIAVPSEMSNELPVAVLGIDLGIKKAACTTLVTPEKVRETRYFV
jgi:transposase